MKKLFKNVAALALAGTMVMGLNVPVLADTGYQNDTDSHFTKTGTDALTGISDFNIIKDYDSKNPTATEPKSQSPAETFTYTITPYAVWNAGSTYSGTTPPLSGTATPITTANMPMLTATTKEADGIKATPSGAAGTSRTLKIEQKVDINKAQYNDSTEEAFTTDTKSLVTLPTYDTVGDYWYKVEETLGNTTGVLYGTNSLNSANNSTTNTTEQNGGHLRIYYIHVQVTETSSEAGTSTLIKNVTMHQSAPDPSTTSTDALYNNKENITDQYYVENNKVNAIENTYYAGDLVIKKEVTGNGGDKDAYFEVIVTFTKPSGTVVNSDIPFTAFAKSGGEPGTFTSKNCVIKGQKSENATTYDYTYTWSTSGSDTDEKTVTCTFYVKDNDTVTFSNIPYGINYTIQETKPADDIYKNKIVFTSNTADETVKFDGQEITKDSDDSSNTLSDDFSKTLVGSISDNHDEITITNNKVVMIDIGVITSNAPYIAMLVLAGVALVVLVRRKNHFEE